MLSRAQALNRMNILLLDVPRAFTIIVFEGLYLHGLVQNKHTPSFSYHGMSETKSKSQQGESEHEQKANCLPRIDICPVKAIQ